MPSLKEIRIAQDKARLAASAGNPYAEGVYYALSWVAGDTDLPPGLLPEDREAAKEAIFKAILDLRAADARKGEFW